MGWQSEEYIGFSIDYKRVLVGYDQGESMGGGYGICKNTKLYVFNDFSLFHCGIYKIRIFCLARTIYSHTTHSPSQCQCCPTFFKYRRINLLLNRIKHFPIFPTRSALHTVIEATFFAHTVRRLSYSFFSLS